MPVLPRLANPFVLGAPKLLTISSGVVAVGTDTFYAIAVESGYADDLDTITGGVAGKIIVIQTNYTAGGPVITVKDNGVTDVPAADRIALSGNADLTLGFGGALTLIHDGVGWREIGRSTRSYF